MSDMIKPGDEVFVYVAGKNTGSADVVGIEPDQKPGWWLVRLDSGINQLSLILRDAYLQGEPFTMKGIEFRIEKVPSPKKETTIEFLDNIISFAAEKDRRR